MLELIGGAVVVWLIFKLLDGMFSKKQKLPDLKPGEYIIQTKNGEHYIVKDVPEPEIHDEPGRVVKFPPLRRQYSRGLMVHTRLVSGRRPVSRIVREGAQTATPVYMCSKTRLFSASASIRGVCM